MLGINRVYCVDCFDFMKYIPDKSIDAVVTDPPFGINFYGYKDVAISPEKYGEFIMRVFDEIKRVLKIGGFYAIWQGAPYFRYFWFWFGEDIHIYAGCKNFVQLRKTPINYAFDPIIMGYFGKPEIRPNKPKRSVDFYVANTAKFVTQVNAIERGHPCPRPIDQVTEIVDNFVGNNALVLDPFIGSGTTAVACLNTGRNFIGSEISQEYCDIANQRIRQVMNGRLGFAREGLIASRRSLHGK